MERRNYLFTLSCSVASSAFLVGNTTATTQTEVSDPVVSFENQESDGSSVVITRAATNVEGFVVIEDSNRELVVRGPDNRLNLAANEVAEDVTLQFNEQISETQQLTALLYESNGGVIARDTASIGVNEEPPQQTAEVSSPTVSFDNQESDGSSVVITRAATTVEGFVAIENSNREFVVQSPDNRLNLAANEVAENATVQFEEPISETQQLTALLFESNGGVIARDTAIIILDDEAARATTDAENVEEQEATNDTTNTTDDEAARVTTDAGSVEEQNSTGDTTNPTGDEGAREPTDADSGDQQESSGETTETTIDDTPGLGIGTAIAGIGSAGLLLKRRLNTAEDRT